MNKVLSGVLGFMIALTVLSNSVIAGASTDVKALTGKVHVEKSPGGEITAITVKPAAGDAVQLVVDEISKELVKIDGHGVFATGSYTENGSFRVATWFMRD